jgi:hypothetical protein
MRIRHNVHFYWEELGRKPKLQLFPQDFQASLIEDGFEILFRPVTRRISDACKVEIYIQSITS